jgi:formyltetrahydrofolate deformylase
VTDVVLTLSCEDRLGIVQAVAEFLAERQLNILESQQFGDQASGRFFMRVHAAAVGEKRPVEDLRAEFTALGERFAMTWALSDPATRPKVLLMVSRLGHCLNDLLYRHYSGTLRIDIPAIASNHPDLEHLATTYNIPFVVLPAGKPNQEALVLEMVADLQVDFVVLARYMQILSGDFVDRLPGRIINIHHGLLPSFKGAGPYRQAFDGGVKVIGATAHFVTQELDEGPIIEQMVSRVDHSADPEQIASISRDLESSALARAVQWHVEHRVLLNGRKTVVFS